MIGWRERLTHEVMFSLDRARRRSDASLWSDRSRGGMVAAAHYMAARAGVEALEEGANAFDAAVITSLALSVCEPGGSGLCGMAQMVAHDAAHRRTFVISGACLAPRGATPEEAVRSNRRRGYRAIAVPAYPSVIAHLLRRHGTVSRERALAPAIALAEEGVPITALQNRLAHRYRLDLQGAAAGLFLNGRGEPLPAGSLLRQPAMAATLRRLARAGFEDFYRGETGRRMAEDIAAHEGLVTADDLRAVGEPEEVEPVLGRYGSREVAALPPPGGGISLLQMLRMHEAMAESAADPDTPEGAVQLAALIHRVRRDRRRWRLREGAAHSPAERASPGHAAEAAQKILDDLAAGGETTHLSVMDRHGNAVALTQSLERTFGAGVMCEDLGLLYNGYMQAFKVINTRHPHFLRPGAVARSNACPTILLEDGLPQVVIGSTGSERLASGVVQVLVRLRLGQDPFQAVHAPRLHCTPEQEVLLEAKRFPKGTQEALQRQGFHPRPLAAYSFHVGGMHLVVREGDEQIGVAEPRRDGAAAGPEVERSSRDRRDS